MQRRAVCICMSSLPTWGGLALARPRHRVETLVDVGGACATWANLAQGAAICRRPAPWRFRGVGPTIGNQVPSVDPNTSRSESAGDGSLKACLGIAWRRFLDAEEVLRSKMDHCRVGSSKSLPDLAENALDSSLFTKMTIRADDAPGELLRDLLRFWALVRHKHGHHWAKLCARRYGLARTNEFTELLRHDSFDFRPVALCAYAALLKPAFGLKALLFGFQA